MFWFLLFKGLYKNVLGKTNFRMINVEFWIFDLALSRVGRRNSDHKFSDRHRRRSPIVLDWDEVEGSPVIEINFTWSFWFAPKRTKRARLWTYRHGLCIYATQFPHGILRGKGSISVEQNNRVPYRSEFVQIRDSVATLFPLTIQVQKIFGLDWWRDCMFCIKAREKSQHSFTKRTFMLCNRAGKSWPEAIIVGSFCLLLAAQK